MATSATLQMQLMQQLILHVIEWVLVLVQFWIVDVRLSHLKVHIHAQITPVQQQRG